MVGLVPVRRIHKQQQAVVGASGPYGIARVAPEQRVLLPHRKKEKAR